MSTLDARDLTFSYAKRPVVCHVSIQIPAGGAVALMGTNGAGKSTTAKLVSGLLHPDAGQIFLGATDITRAAAPERARVGVGLVPQGRRLFARQSVRTNLELGAFPRRATRRELRADLDEMCTAFPAIADRLEHPAGLLSGGEQQMVAIARALMGRPRFLLIDEPSIGLSPVMVERIRDLLGTLRRVQVGILLIEENVDLALSICDYAYVMNGGRVVLESDSETLKRDQVVRDIYLGAEVGAKTRRPRSSGPALPDWLRTRPAELASRRPLSEEPDQ